TDDVLQLTVTSPDTSSERFYGRVATVLPNDSGDYGILGGLLGGLISPGVIAPPGKYWPNQPEFDDVQGTPNGLGSSPLAEVAYFLRNGSLYRRVMLIRKPNVASAVNDYAPVDQSGCSLSLGLYESAGTRNFYADFDYSVFSDGAGIRFHGGSSLYWCAT